MSSCTAQFLIQAVRRSKNAKMTWLRFKACLLFRDTYLCTGSGEIPLSSLLLSFPSCLADLFTRQWASKGMSLRTFWLPHIDGFWWPRSDTMLSLYFDEPFTKGTVRRSWDVGDTVSPAEILAADITCGLHCTRDRNMGYQHVYLCGSGGMMTASRASGKRRTSKLPSKAQTYLISLVT